MFPHLAAPILRVSTPFVRLLDLSSINPLLNFSRASAAAFNHSTDLTLVEVGNNVPRFDPALGLLIEGQRTNLNTNPRAEGWTAGVVGSGGVLPTGWGANISGLPPTVVGSITVNNVPLLLLRFNGTPTVITPQTLQPGGQDAVAIGTNVSSSLHFMLQAGALTNFGGFTLRSATEAGVTILSTPFGVLQQVRNVRTTTAALSSTILRWNFNDTVTPVDFTIAVGLTTREHAPFVSSTILPTPGTPLVSTRLADNLSVPLSALGIGDNGACTIWGSFRVPFLNPVAVQNIIQLDDNTGNNRYVTRLETSGLMQSSRVLAGAVLSGGNNGAVVVNTNIPFAITIDGAGRVATSRAGGGAIVATGGPTSGLITLRLGSDAGALAYLFGYMPRLNYLPYAVSDSQLIALSTGT